MSLFLTVAVASSVGAVGGCSWSALSVFYNVKLLDNTVAPADSPTAAAALAGGAKLYGQDNGFAPAAGCAAAMTGTRLLSTYVAPASGGYTDTFLTGSAAGEQWAVAHNYSLLRREGLCFESEAACVGAVNQGVHSGDGAGTASRLRAGTALGEVGCSAATQWYSVARSDHFLALNGTVHERDAAGAGYVAQRAECWLADGGPRMWSQWPAAGPANGTTPESCPFEQSTDLTGFQFLSGGNANYGGADTWYPTWAADGNLYTPWTDGTVAGVRSGSGGHGAGGVGDSTTGQARVIGDDPYALNVTAVDVFHSNTAPYQGRYPCGSLYYEGTWYYGTYSLENPSFPPNPLPNCGNWCVQGPFCGFRQSTDQGATWHEPRLTMASDRDNLFGESAMNNSKVKFGAPHVVDFGQELEHSPDGRVYIVGHGASLPTAHQSWMQGDEVYTARCCGSLPRGKPTPAGMNDLSQWQFWSGPEREWVSGAEGVAAARPIFAWQNHTGVVTMTFVPALRKFITSVSTPTFSPFTTKQFDTYFLESDAITGPFRIVQYMYEFGPEAYFVNIPSKFIDAAPAGGAAAGAPRTMGMFLSYSANFAFHDGANPPGSGYHWSLQQMRFTLNITSS